MMKVFLAKLAFILLLATVYSCGEEQERQEVLNRLRGLGVVAFPLVSEPSSDNQPNRVDVSIYVAIPKGESIVSAEPFTDESIPGAYMVGEEQVSIDTSSINYDDYNGFRVANMTASVVVPEEASFRILSNPFIGAQLRYGFAVSTSNDTEYITGSFLVYPKGSDELSWSNPTVTLNSPVSGASFKAGEEVSLEATIINPNEEPIKIGWFCDDGKIVNRRSSSTTWIAPSQSGQYTIFMTVRGKSSRGFSMEAIQVTVI